MISTISTSRSALDVWYDYRRRFRGRRGVLSIGVEQCRLARPQMLSACGMVLDGVTKERGGYPSVWVRYMN